MKSYEKETITKIYKVIFACKKVGSFPVSEKTFEKYFNTIRNIASLERNATEYLNVSFDKWEIPNFLIDFTLPNSVTIACHRTEVDFLSRPTAVETSLCMSKSDFDDCTDAIFAGFKTTREGKISKLDVKKVDMTLGTAVVSSANSEDKCLYNSTAYVPIYLTSDFMKTEFYLENVVEIIEAYIRSCLVALK